MYTIMYDPYSPPLPVSIPVVVVQTWSPQQCLKVEKEGGPLLIRYAWEGIIRVNSSQTWHQCSQHILVVTLEAVNLRGCISRLKKPKFKWGYTATTVTHTHTHTWQWVTCMTLYIRYLLHLSRLSSHLQERSKQWHCFFRLLCASLTVPMACKWRSCSPWSFPTIFLSR